MRPPRDVTVHRTWQRVPFYEDNKIQEALCGLVNTHPNARSYQRHSIETMQHLMGEGTLRCSVFAQGEPNNVTTQRIRVDRVWRGQIWQHREIKQRYVCAFFFRRLLPGDDALTTQQPNVKSRFLVTASSASQELRAHGKNRNPNDDLLEFNELCWELLEQLAPEGGEPAPSLDIFGPEPYPSPDPNINEPCPVDPDEYPDLTEVWKLAVVNTAAPMIHYDTNSPITVAAGNVPTWNDQWIGQSAYRWVVTPHAP